MLSLHLRNQRSCSAKAIFQNLGPGCTTRSLSFGRSINASPIEIFARFTRLSSIAANLAKTTLDTCSANTGEATFLWQSSTFMLDTSVIHLWWHDSTMPGRVFKKDTNRQQLLSFQPTSSPEITNLLKSLPPWQHEGRLHKDAGQEGCNGPAMMTGFPHARVDAT
jgi:hypothetical protein